MSTPRLNSYLHHYVKRNSLIPLQIDASVLAYEYEAGVDDPIAFNASDYVKGAGLSSIVIESSGIVDADEALEITYGGTAYTIDLDTDGNTTLYGLINEPDFVVTVASGALSIAKGVY